MLKIFIALFISIPTSAAAQHTENYRDTISFFENEAMVVTASRQPQPKHRSPQTVYVLTGEELRDMGAVTIWDALRNLPGIDVVETRTNRAEVSVRGLVQPLNNRTQVLLDGRTVLNGFQQFVSWESIPVQISEIDRIEVVAGPASALYGANAFHGVINIITRKPAQISGGDLRYMYGTHSTRGGSALYGAQNGPLSYKVSASRYMQGSFEDHATGAVSVSKASTLASWKFEPENELSISGGYTEDDSMLTTGAGGKGSEQGPSHFLRTEYRRKGFYFNSFWNSGRARLVDFSLPSNIYYDTYDVSLEQRLTLPYDNTLVSGVSVRRNIAESGLVDKTKVTQNLAAVYAENHYSPIDALTLVGSIRCDKHPYTGYRYSPHGSVVYSPDLKSTLRVSGGRGFRPATIIENHMSLVSVVPNTDPATSGAGFSTLRNSVVGNPRLKSEKIEQWEVSYERRVSWVSAAISGYHSVGRNLITPSSPLVSLSWPAINIVSSYDNKGKTRTNGVETSLQGEPAAWLNIFAAYTYAWTKQYLYTYSMVDGSPEQKLSGGLRIRDGGWTIASWANWTDHAAWLSQGSNNWSDPLQKVNQEPHTRLNFNLSYRFKGRLAGLGASIGGYDILMPRHSEILARQSPSWPGLYGETLEPRWVAMLNYDF